MGMEVRLVMMLIMEGDQLGRHSDFSIDHILNRAGNRPKSEDSVGGSQKFEWMQCSRYCPPKVPRVIRKDGFQKRQLGRHPRIPFTGYQLSLLEQKFKDTPYLSSEEVTLLSKKLNLADIRVKIWFQNRRARERREKNVQFKPVNSDAVEERTPKTSNSFTGCIPNTLCDVESAKNATNYRNTPRGPSFLMNSILGHGVVPYFVPVMGFEPGPSNKP